MVIFHLTYLLTKHECVIVPNLGAFVVNAVNASFDSVGGVFIAPSQSLGFNPELKHNDGLLANSLMKDQSISYNEANLQIRKFVDELWSRINNQKEYDIPGLGKLSCAVENKLIFSPAKKLPCQVTHYGFSNFYLPALSTIERTSESVVSADEKPKEKALIPIGKKVFRAVSAVAACLIAFFLFSTPIEYKDVSSHYAAVLLPSIANESNVTSESSHTRNVEEPVNPFMTEVPNIIFSTETSDALKQDTIQVVAENPVIEIEKPSRYYYIIVASLPSRKSADEMLKMPQFAVFDNAAVLERDSKFRIYTNRFTDKSEAESFLLQFRTDNPKHSNAWLLSDRVNS